MVRRAGRPRHALAWGSEIGVWQTTPPADDFDAVAAAAEAVSVATGTRMLMAPPMGGWVNVYPEFGKAEPGMTVAIGGRVPGLVHAIMLLVADSDVLSYWYFRDGVLADSFNSCPDYYGQASEEDMAAKGRPDAFDGLLDAGGRARLARIVGTRMINGEWTAGEGPTFAEEGMTELGSILGIGGVPASLECLLAGEEVPGIPPVGELHHVG